MNKQLNLINSIFLPIDMQDKTIIEQYAYLQKMYNSGKHYILLNNTNIFGPYPQPDVPWDISEAQKIVIYQQDVAKTNKWLLNEIFNKSALFDYRTLSVLIRIATGMLNKCNIPKELQIMYHDNMVKNLKDEYDRIVMSGLPF